MQTRAKEIKQTLAGVVPAGVDGIIASYDNPAEEILALFQGEQNFAFQFEPLSGDESKALLAARCGKGGSWGIAYTGNLKTDSITGEVVLHTGEQPPRNFIEDVLGTTWLRPVGEYVLDIGWMLYGHKQVLFPFVKSIKDPAYEYYALEGGSLDHYWFCLRLRGAWKPDSSLIAPRRWI